MRTPEDEAKTQEQVEEIAAHCQRLNQWEQHFIGNQLGWIAASKHPWWHADQASKIEQIWKERVKSK